MSDLQILAQSLFPDFKALDSGELDFKDFFTKYQNERTTDLDYLRKIYEGTKKGEI